MIGEAREEQTALERSGAIWGQCHRDGHHTSNVPFTVTTCDREAQENGGGQEKHLLLGEGRDRGILAFTPCLQSKMSSSLPRWDESGLPRVPNFSISVPTSLVGSLNLSTWVLTRDGKVLAPQNMTLRRSRRSRHAYGFRPPQVPAQPSLALTLGQSCLHIPWSCLNLTPPADQGPLRSLGQPWSGEGRERGPCQSSRLFQRWMGESALKEEPSPGQRSVILPHRLLPTHIHYHPA